MYDQARQIKDVELKDDCKYINLLFTSDIHGAAQREEISVW